jgi:hypothetical protein
VGYNVYQPCNKKRVYAYDDPSKLWRRSKNRCPSARTVRRVSLSKDEPMGWITDRGRLCPDEWLLTQEITGNFHGSRPIEQ